MIRFIFLLTGTCAGGARSLVALVNKLRVMIGAYVGVRYIDGWCASACGLSAVCGRASPQRGNLSSFSSLFALPSGASGAVALHP